MDSLLHIKRNFPDIYNSLIENGYQCKVTKYGKSLYEGKLTRSSLVPYYGDNLVLVEVSIADDTHLLFTIEENLYIDEVKSLSNSTTKIEDMLDDPKMYNKAVFLSSLIPELPMIDEDFEKKYGHQLAKIKALLEAEEDEGGASMDGGDESSGDEGGASMDVGDEQTADSDASTEQPETNNDPDAALGQKGAEEDKDAKRRADVKFTIWTDENKSTTSIKKGEKYLKIEYVYRNKKKNVVIDFLIGKDLNERKWSLFAGKPGSATYDDDPIKDLKAETLADAINNSIDEVLKVIDDVEGDPDNWVQFYVHR